MPVQTQIKKILLVVFLFLLFANPCKAADKVIHADSRDDSLWFQAQTGLLGPEPSWQCINNENKNATVNTHGFSVPGASEIKYEYIIPFANPEISELYNIKSAKLFIYVNSLTKTKGVNSGEWSSYVSSKQGNFISSTTYDGITCADDTPTRNDGSFLTNSVGWHEFNIENPNDVISKTATTTFFLSPLWYSTVGSSNYGYLGIRTANYSGTTYDPRLEIELELKYQPTITIGTKQGNSIYTDFGLLFFLIGVIIIIRIIKIC